MNAGPLRLYSGEIADAEQTRCMKRKSQQQEPCRKRPDVTARRAANAGTTISVVKCTLNKFMRPAASQLRPVIDEAVRHVNQAIAEAYLLGNLHIVRLCAASSQIPPLTTSFFYGCLSAVTRATRQKPEAKNADFRESVDMYRTWAGDHVPPESDHLSSGFHQQASQQMAINTAVGIAETCRRRLKNYLVVRYGIPSPDARRRVREIMAIHYEGDDPIVVRYRSRLPQVHGARVEDDAHAVIPLLFDILTYFEDVHARSSAAGERPPRGVRLFSLLPHKHGFTIGHVKMCTNGLYGILKRSGAFPEMPTGQAPWRAVADEFWRRLFRIDKLETCNRKFAGEVVTDGHSVSVVMRKPEPTTRATVARTIDEYDQIYGLDPGRRDLYTTCDLDGKHWHHSSR